jgi:hypothetical protein
VRCGGHDESCEERNKEREDSEAHSVCLCEVA